MSLFFVFSLASYSCPLRVFLQKYGEEPGFILSAKEIEKIIRNREKRRHLLLIIFSYFAVVAANKQKL
jgi:hypothetical protein